jgi:erythromycin esterase
VVAVESGFAEGQLVDEWIRGGDGDLAARDGFTFHFSDSAEVQDLLSWLRTHNAAGGRVRFSGVDVPGSGGSGVPALRQVRDYLPADKRFLVDNAIEATEATCLGEQRRSPGRYAATSDAQRNAATIALTSLFEALEGPGQRNT